MELKYIVKENDCYNTINEILKNEFKLSTRLLSKLIRLRVIMLNGSICDTRNSVKTDDIITVSFDYEEENDNIVPTKMDLDIIYEDEWFLVINKKPGIAIHPSILHYENSLANGVRFYFDSICLNKKIRPVNRLDKNTSGLVIFAKCEYIQECFSSQMKDGTFEKEYYCLVEGFIIPKSGTINLPIARKNDSIIERCIDNSGQNAITIYNTLKNFDNFSFVSCKLVTGRTHQIRVHMKEIGHPLLGDTLYGNSSNLIDRQALHSYKIKCVHPVTNKLLEFIAPIPEDFKFIMDF